MDTNRRAAKFISSHQTESSGIQKRTIKLGEALVKELGLETSNDTLARWMAHYIAEQMIIAKKAKGEAKAKAEQECFETILKLWQHRSHLPNGIRPFESFDPIFRALEGLDPENKRPYFYRHQDSPKKDVSDKDVDNLQKCLDVAQAIDKAARIWLEFMFHQAALSAIDKKTITWLENAVDDSGRDEVAIIVRLANAGLEDLGDDEQTTKARQEKLEFRISQLDAFIKFSKTLRVDFANELKMVAAKKPSGTKTLDANLKSKRKSNNKSTSK